MNIMDTAKKNLQVFYSTNKYYFESIVGVEEDFMRNFEEALKEINPSDILDVGCGSGLLANELALRGYMVTAIDLSPIGVSLGKKRSKRMNTSAQFLVSDAENLPFKSRSIDVLISTNVLEHFMNPDVCISEMARISKKAIIIKCPNSRFVSGPLSISKIVSKPKIAFRFLFYFSDFVRYIVHRSIPIRSLNPDLSIENWRSDSDAVCAINIFKCMEILERCGLKVSVCRTFAPEKKVLNKLPIVRFFGGQIILIALKQGK